VFIDLVISVLGPDMEDEMYIEKFADGPQLEIMKKLK